MKRFYDKIILAVGLIALGGSGAYYASQQGVTAPIKQATPAGADYVVLPVPEVTVQTAIWNDPIPFDEKGFETYDVFTPPKIWWLEDEQKFIFEAPESPPPPIPFGLKFVSVERELYRIQLEGYAEALSGKDRDASISLLDNLTGESFRGKVGQVFAEHEAEIIDFQVDKVVNENGTIRRIPKVTVKDAGSGELIVLTTDEHLYIPNSYKMTFETRSPYPKQTFVWEEVGDSKVVADVTFKLLDFVFDKQAATVEKTFADDKPAETESLIVAPEKPTEPVASGGNTEENSPESENTGVLDNLFQN